MKKIYIGLFWACILGITGCYEDDSTMATPESMVNEITIEEFADTSAVAYSTVLELTPKVTGYSDTELEYRWYIYGVRKTVIVPCKSVRKKSFPILWS